MTGSVPGGPGRRAGSGSGLAIKPPASAATPEVSAAPPKTVATVSGIVSSATIPALFSSSVTAVFKPSSTATSAAPSETSVKASERARASPRGPSEAPSAALASSYLYSKLRAQKVSAVKVITGSFCVAQTAELDESKTRGVERNPHRVQFAELLKLHFQVFLFDAVEEPPDVNSSAPVSVSVAHRSSKCSVNYKRRSNCVAENGMFVSAVWAKSCKFRGTSPPAS